MTPPALSYHGYRFPPEIINHAVWLYHRFCFMDFLNSVLYFDYMVENFNVNPELK